MTRNLLVLAAVAAVGFATNAASAATLVVNDFGAGGWTSWDTRNTSGTQLVGTNDTNAAGPAYFGVSASSASDTAISNQIVFMGEGQTVNDAAGSTPPVSPTGSLNGLGYVRLDGTSSNSGKSDISYVNISGIAAASTLLDPNFTATYTFYAQTNTNSRQPGLNISILGTDGNQYTLSYTAPSYSSNAWNTETADNSTSDFSLYVSGSGPVSGSNTLAGWEGSSFGTDIFGSGAEIQRVGFNIGSGQKDGLVYLDDLQTSILNGGDVIDFQGPSAAPLPSAASMGLGMLGLIAAAGLLRKKLRTV